MELFRALALFAEPPQAQGVRVAEALELGAPPTESEYTETFLFQLYPYASVYLGAEGMLGGVARDRVAGFWRALHLTPAAEADHLSLMLALYAQLCEAEETATAALRRERWRHARKAFLWEHLLSWLPVYLHKLESISAPFYGNWARLLGRALLEELEKLGGLDQLPLHLRDEAALLDPREHETEAFLQSLLAPARSGMIITRADLMRAARALGLGLRMGERKFILKSLFSQDARALLGWLLEESKQWRQFHRGQEALGLIAEAWGAKAVNTAELLKELDAPGEEAP
jgi:TorA maturation chaperone TorD